MNLPFHVNLSEKVKSIISPFIDISSIQQLEYHQHIIIK